MIKMDKTKTKTKRFTMEISADTQKRLKIIAAENNCSLAEIGRELFDNYVMHCSDLWLSFPPDIFSNLDFLAKRSNISVDDYVAKLVEKDMIFNMSLLPKKEVSSD